MALARCKGPVFKLQERYALHGAPTVLGPNPGVLQPLTEAPALTRGVAATRRPAIDPLPNELSLESSGSHHEPCCDGRAPYGMYIGIPSLSHNATLLSNLAKGKIWRIPSSVKLSLRSMSLLQVFPISPFPRFPAKYSKPGSCPPKPRRRS